MSGSAAFYIYGAKKRHSSNECPALEEFCWYLGTPSVGGIWRQCNTILHQLNELLLIPEQRNGTQLDLLGEDFPLIHR